MIGVRLEIDRIGVGGVAGTRSVLHDQASGMVSELRDSTGFVIADWNELFDEDEDETDTISITGYVSSFDTVLHVARVADTWRQIASIGDVRIGVGDSVPDIVVQPYDDFVSRVLAEADTPAAIPTSSAPPPPAALPVDLPKGIGGAVPPDTGAGNDGDGGHQAYGLLRAPAEVVAGVEFLLEVGLSQEPAPGVAGPPLPLPPLEITPYTVDVRISAPGFDLPDGESPHRPLKVHTNNPYPIETIRLIPGRPRGKAINRTVTAEYSIDGERLGDAIRIIRVIRTETHRRRPADERVEAGANVLAPTGEEKADLTITIRTLGFTSPMWTFISPHADVLPNQDGTYTRPIGDPAAFLSRFIESVDAAEGQKGVFDSVSGLAFRVTEAIPDEIWQAIRAVAQKLGAPPTILLVSEDPFVPWEIALVDEDRPLVPGTNAPPFLCAQTRIGRWVQSVGFVDGRERPSPNPPRAKDVESVAVVWGDYTGTRWANLDHAKAEGEQLAQLYGATRIEPTHQAMSLLLHNDPPADLLHFAVHGRYSPGRVETGIILTDGRNLDATTIAPRDLERNPVVFLNACQLAAGERELGSYSSVAAAFVQAGASAVVAPLWKVDDEHALEIALDFYKRSAAGESLSEVLRKSREAFVSDYELTSSTWMAYQLFGHPAFVIRGLASGGG